MREGASLPVSPTSPLTTSNSGEGDVELWGAGGWGGVGDDDDKVPWRKKRERKPLHSITSPSPVDRARERQQSQREEKKQREEKYRRKVTPIVYLHRQQDLSGDIIEEEEVVLVTIASKNYTQPGGRVNIPYVDIVRHLPPTWKQVPWMKANPFQIAPNVFVTGFTGRWRHDWQTEKYFNPVINNDEPLPPMRTEDIRLTSVNSRVITDMVNEIRSQVSEYFYFMDRSGIASTIRNHFSEANDLLEAFNIIAYRLLEEELGMRSKDFDWKQLIRDMVVSYNNHFYLNRQVPTDTQRPTYRPNPFARDDDGNDEDLTAVLRIARRTPARRANHYDLTTSVIRPLIYDENAEAKERHRFARQLPRPEFIHDIEVEPPAPFLLADDEKEQGARRHQRGLNSATPYYLPRYAQSRLPGEVYSDEDEDEDSEPTTDDGTGQGSGLFSWVGNMGKKGLNKLMNAWRRRNCGAESRELLPGEFHYGCHNFTGPGTRMDLFSGAPAINPIDECSRIHDVAYGNAALITDLAARARAIHLADLAAIRCYNRTPEANGYRAAVAGIGGKFGAEQILSMIKGQPSVFYG